MPTSVRALAIAAALLLSAGPASARIFQTGFTDSAFFERGASAATWFQRAADSRADIVELGANWGSIAGVKPSAPSDPNNAAYDWSGLDAAVMTAAQHGLDVLMVINHAPAWAEGSHRAKSAPAGTWRPSPTKLAQFARALATHYDGAHGLPRVRNFQVWAEPNLFTNLTPQYVRKHRRYRMASPGIYRSMLNAAYRAIKSAQPTADVIAGGTAPYGDLKPGGGRIMPVAFLRSLLSRKTRFNDFAHDPYSVGSPQRHALNREDVSINDVEKLTRVLKARGHRRSKLWVSEVSWDSSPPDPEGVPAATHARWVAETMEILWRKRVRTMIWFQIRDAAPVPDYASTYQSGVYLRDGAPKLAQRAFRLPFVVRKGRVWGRSPDGSVVTIERRSGSLWVVVGTTRPDGSRVFSKRLAVHRGRTYRARTASETSLAYRAR